jgi:ferric-dicitrate binding protein FerR (iron transport regulator)
MTQQEFDIILQRYLNDQATEEEKRMVEDWFDNMEQPENLIEPTLKERIRKKIWAHVEEHSDINIKHAPWYIRMGRVAAASAFIILSFFLIKEYSIDEAADIAEKISPLTEISNDTKIVQRVSLVDGTFVDLSPGGIIKFPKKFTNKREVYLDGEAFFEVKKDSLRPFLVYTREITTRVLGTSFRIHADDNANEFIVSVKTGKVSVLPSDNLSMQMKTSPVVLIPNQQVIYNRQEKSMHKTLVDEPKMITEKTVRESNYTNALVVEILNALEKDYGINVEYNNEALKDCTLTSDMTEEDFYERIDIICNAIGAKYEIQDTTVVITGKGCK